MEGDTHHSEANFATEDLVPNAWICRPCEWYWDDYKECTKLWSRYFQYFVHGYILDCNQWKVDYENCMHFRRTRNLESLQKVIDSETRRIEKRKKASLANDVWQLRESPPTEMWNLPLPEWLKSRYVGTLLEYYQKARSNSAK